MDEGVAIPDIRAAETCGGDWCCWAGVSLNAGASFDVTAEIALSVATSTSDYTLSSTEL